MTSAIQHCNNNKTPIRSRLSDILMYVCLYIYSCKNIKIEFFFIFMAAVFNKIWLWVATSDQC